MSSSDSTPLKFSLNDLAIAGDMSKRSAQLLSDEGLLPKPHGVAAVKRVAVIGALVGVGMPLMAAGRLAAALAHMEFNQYDGEIPAGFNDLAREIAKSEDAPRMADLENDYLIHETAFARPEIYSPGKVLLSDAMLEIVDREYVYVGNAVKLAAYAKPDGNIHHVSFSGRLEGWDRNTEIRFVSAAEIYVFDPEDPKYESDRRHREEYMINHVRPKALGKLTVNLSLAIRTGFDRLQFSDLERGKKHRKKGRSKK